MNMEKACASLADSLVLAADDELTTAEWHAVEQHLEECPACRAQWSAFARLDRRLLECRAAIRAPSPPDQARRARLARALSRRTPEQRKRGWAVASFATLGLAVLTLIALAPLNREVRQPAAVVPGTEVLRVNVPLAPIGGPFLDSSITESLIQADVTIGSDGQPMDIKLAE